MSQLKKSAHYHTLPFQNHLQQLLWYEIDRLVIRCVRSPELLALYSLRGAKFVEKTFSNYSRFLWLSRGKTFHLYLAKNLAIVIL